MKKILVSLSASLLILCASAQEGKFVLNLSDNDITYNDNNTWSDLFVDKDFTADGYIFSHTAPYGDGYYEGFIASRNTDNANHYDAPGWTANQWGCMAQGGVNLTSDKSAPTAIEGKPFLINYFSAYSLSVSDYGTSYITMADHNTFHPYGVYVCNSPWGYYGCTEGDGFATPLVEEGGYYKITFNGVNTENGTTKSVDYYLAERQYSDRNSDGIINEKDNYTNREWQWCDLTALGAVNLIYISMDSSDKGDYGMNTSTIVCLDGLECHLTGNVTNINNESNKIYSSAGNLFITIHKAQEITLCSTAGTVMGSYRLNAGSHIIDLSHLPQGVYIVGHSSGCNKIVL